MIFQASYNYREGSWLPDDCLVQFRRVHVTLWDGVGEKPDADIFPPEDALTSIVLRDPASVPKKDRTLQIHLNRRKLGRVGKLCAVSFFLKLFGKLSIERFQMPSKSSRARTRQKITPRR